MKRGNYAAAAARFQEALKWNPRLAAAYLKLGEAYEKRGELNKALETYRKYLELEPSSKKARPVQKVIARLERELKEIGVRRRVLAHRSLDPLPFMEDLWFEDRND